ncbi:hypothetical protein ACFLT2_09545 [Acidobacteriota bacterium]
MKGMKIDNEEIEKLYKAYIAEKTPQKRDDCPSPESIFSLFQPNTAEDIRNETLTHVLECSHCIKDFQFILSTQREEMKFFSDIEVALKPAKKELKKRKESKSFLLRLSWKYAVFLFGAAIVVVLFVLNIPDKNVYRGTNHKSIRLISPLDQHDLKSSLSFEWETVENSDYFILEIFDESLYPIWKSDKIRGNRLKLPSHILAKFDVSSVYYWTVTAFMPNDRILESKLQKFKIFR